MYDAAKNRHWTVRPIGITYLEPDEPTVICILVHTVGGVNLSKQRTEDSEDHYAKDGIELMVQGPNNQLIPLSEYNKKVMSGCISCQQPLTIEDAEDIEWHNGDSDPLCGPCCDELTAEFGRGWTKQ
jgi:hypothetical protein